MPEPDARRLSVSLEINGLAWHQVDSLAASGPRDRHFTLELQPGGFAVLRFGDGARGARPPSGARQMRVRCPPGAGHLALVLQQGHAARQPEDERFFGVYRAIVTAVDDPQSAGRLRVQCPEVLGEAQTWALPCRPAHTAALPALGEYIWLLFEHGDPAYPVWIGVFSPPAPSPGPLSAG